MGHCSHAVMRASCRLHRVPEDQARLAVLREHVCASVQGRPHCKSQAAFPWLWERLPAPAAQELLNTSFRARLSACFTFL